MHPSLIEFIEQASFEIKNALDIGCGNGKYLLFLNKMGFQITGLDSSPTAISMATDAAKDAGHFLVADMYDYPFPANVYDLVISHAALHHGIKAKVVSLVGKIHDILVVNGKIFLSLPSDDCKKNWAMMAGHEILADGTCIPLRGQKKGCRIPFFRGKK